MGGTISSLPVPRAASRVRAWFTYFGCRVFICIYPGVVKHYLTASPVLFRYQWSLQVNGNRIIPFFELNDVPEINPEPFFSPK